MHLSRFLSVINVNWCALKQEQQFKVREDIMMTKNAELEESLVSFSKYLQENDVKRARASKKAVDEARACEEKSKEAEGLVLVFLLNPTLILSWAHVPCDWLSVIT